MQLAMIQWPSPQRDSHIKETGMVVRNFESAPEGSPQNRQFIFAISSDPQKYQNKLSVLEATLRETKLNVIQAFSIPVKDKKY